MVVVYRLLLNITNMLCCNGGVRRSWYQWLLKVCSGLINVIVLLCLRREMLPVLQDSIERLDTLSFVNVSLLNIFLNYLFPLAHCLTSGHVGIGSESALWVIAL